MGRALRGKDAIVSEEHAVPASTEELARAYWVADYAHEVATQIIENGHPDADSFMSLCSSLEALRGLMRGGHDEFYERAEELYGLILEEAAADEIKPRL